MNKKEIIHTVSTKYAPLNSECKSEFFNNSKILTFKKGDTLVKEGQHSDKAYFIVSGSTRA
jgi:CRP-like cAMP-binding protein